MEVLGKPDKVATNGGVNGVSGEADKETVPAAVVLHYSGEMLEPDEADRIDARPKHKAPKRRLRVNSKSDDVVMVEPGSPLSPTKLLKNMSKDRHSRSGRGRGLPKKGGGGGRYTWGCLVDVYDDSTQSKDSKDPNYNSEDDTESYKVVASDVEMTAEQYAKLSKSTIQDYFEHADPNEVMMALSEYNVKEGRFEMVRILISIAMERKPAYKEMSSRLLSVLHGYHYINSRDITKGFDLLLDELDDLCLDSPDGVQVMGNFLARAVADDCLAPSYLTSEHANELAKSAVKRAHMLVSMKHGMARLDNVWGVGGGQWPVKVLTKQIKMLVEEYFASADTQEANRCVSELDVPHFHHELVYETLVLCIEKNSAAVCDLACSLLDSFYNAAIITKDQMHQGVQRVYADIGDICLDTPTAYSMLEKLVLKGEAQGFISKSLAAAVPQRGRKRFVSENDGGKIKEREY